MEGKDTRNLLADTLLQLMEKQPLRSIRITHLCAAAHTSRAAFYYYFESVDELLKWLFVRELMDPFRKKVLADNVKAALENVFVYIDSHRAVMRSVIGGMQYSEVQKIFSESALPVLEKLLQEDRQRRGSTGDNPQWLAFSARALTGMLTEIYWSYLTGTNMFSRKELVRYAAVFYENLVN